MRQRAAAFIGLLVVLSVAVIYYVVGGTQTAVASCDTGSMAYFASGAEKQNDQVKARYLRQEIAACEAARGGAKETTTPPATSETTTTTSPSSETSTPTTPVDPSTSIAASAPAPTCTVEYLANRPADQKVSPNSYGPQVAQNPAFTGKAMDSLTTDEALAEGQYRRSVDPMLSVEDAIDFGLLPPETDQIAKTQELASNCQAWSDLNAEIDAEMANYDHSIQALAPGKWASTYALAGDIPAVAMDSDVDRSEPFAALVSVRRSDGFVVNRRLACGFQLYQQQVASEAPAAVEQVAPELPAPSPGMSRTPEGTPVVTPPDSTPPGTTDVPSTTVVTTSESTPVTTTSVTTTSTETTSTSGTTTSVATCPPATPYGSPETGCKDSPSDRPTDIPTQQQPNPLPAESSDFQTTAATPPTTYSAPASPEPVPGGGGQPAPSANASSFVPAPTNSGVSPTDGSGNSGTVAPPP